MQTHSSRCDLLCILGNWSVALGCFNKWHKADVPVEVFHACLDEADMEGAMIDATVVAVHYHGQGAKSDRDVGQLRLAIGI